VSRLSRVGGVLLLGLIVVSMGCASAEPISFYHAPPDPVLPSRMAQTPVTPAAPRAVPVVLCDASDVKIQRRAAWADAQPMTHLLDPMGTPTRITVHHEGDFAGITSDAQVCGHLRAIRAHQIKSKSRGGLGAGDIAYTFVIDQKGHIWEGRPIQYQGAHAGNFHLNQGNIGICLLGDFNHQHVPWAQKESLRKLLSMLMRRYSIPSGRIYTHRELKPTECPGKHLQAYMDDLRVKFRYANR